MTKICSDKDCKQNGIEQVLSNFYKSSSRHLYGVGSRCKDCVKRHADGWQRANRKKCSGWVMRWAKANPERSREINARYARNNPAKFNAKNAARRAAKRNATPTWLSEAQRAQIDLMYTLAAFLSRATGEQIEVDHIVPLKGRSVQGLHVPWNLQLLSRRDNLSKGNRFQPEAAVAPKAAS